MLNSKDVSNLNVIEKVREFIVSSVVPGAGADFANDRSMIKSGLINSLTVVEIISFVESEFGIDVADANSDIEIEDFDSVNNIAALVMRRMQLRG